jgi:LacI family transcriptional regulator
LTPKIFPVTVWIIDDQRLGQEFSLMSHRRKAPTLRDIAESAGVSLFTASVVLNGARSNTRVSEDTRRRIEHVARSIGYHPNAMARGLMHQRMNTIGVLFGVVEPAVVLTNPYSTAVLQGILAAASPLRLNVTIFSEPWIDTATSAARFRDGRTDGVIAVAPVAGSDMIAGLVERGVPVVAIAHTCDTLGVPSVDVDNEAGIRLATEHLLGLGHRKIAHLTGDEDMVSVPPRRAAFLATMTAAGIDVPPTYIERCSYNGSGAAEAVRALMALPEPPTAIVAGNDSIALGALGAARDLGLKLPQDLSIVGFDDAPSSALVTPALTTVRQPLLDIGAEALRLLVALIEGESVPSVTHLKPPELVVRDSVAPVLAPEGKRPPSRGIGEPVALQIQIREGTR